MVKKRKSWERWVERRESPAAYDLLLEFYKLGAERSELNTEEVLQIVADRAGRRLKIVQYCYSHFQWVRRSRAYEEHLIKVEQKAIERTVKTEGVVWAQRELEYRHTANNLADDLITKAKEMLAAPLYLTEINKVQKVVVNAETGETVDVPVKITHKPARWTFATVKMLVECADQIKRLSLGIPTSHAKLTLDLDNMSAEDRVKMARAKAAEWMANHLEAALNRVMEDNPHQDREDARGLLLEAVLDQFAQDYKLADSTLLAPFVDEIQDTVTALPLEIEDSTELSM